MSLAFAVLLRLAELAVTSITIYVALHVAQALIVSVIDRINGKDHWHD